MEIDLLDESIVGQIISEIDSSEERQRKIKAWDAFQVYSGNIKPYVEAELQRTRPKSWQSYTVSNVSLSKMVTNKLGQSYKEEPIRDVGSKQKNEVLSDIYYQAEAQRQLVEFDQIFNLHKHALMWINWRTKEQMWQFMALAPYEYSVIRDKDTGKLKCVILQYPDNQITFGSGNEAGNGIADLISENQADGAAQTKVYAMWTAEKHVVVKVQVERVNTREGVKLKKSIEYVPIEDNPNNENPLGVLPFVYVSKDLSVDYPTRNPITEQTITFNGLWSELMTAANIQGSGALTFSYPEKWQGKFDRMPTGLLTAIELPQSSDPDDKPTTAEYLSPSPDLSGQKEVYLTYLRQVLAEHGITSSQGFDGQNQEFNSALERMVANADVQDVLHANQQIYSNVEKQIFKIIKAWNKTILSDGTFSEQDEISIGFKKPRILINDSDTLVNIEKKLMLGLMEKWEALKILDPNLSEDQAREKLQRIEQERQQSVSRFLSGDNEERSQQDD